MVALPQQREKLFLREQQHFAVVERDDAEAPRLIQDASWQVNAQSGPIAVPSRSAASYASNSLSISPLKSLRLCL